MRELRVPVDGKTMAIVHVEQPQSLVASPRSTFSMVRKVKETVEDMERVRRFMSTCLNIELQKWQTRHPYPVQGSEDDKKDWEADRKRLEIDWGTIPGVEKPFLMQPGAEKFIFWLELRPKYFNREVELGDGHLEIISHVVFLHKRTKEEVFEGPDCSCSTMEDNFRFMWAEKPAPCNCWPVKPGCEGCKYKEDKIALGMGRKRKVNEYRAGKKVGSRWAWQERVEIPNISNKRNAVRQIGQKRALVKGVRNMGAISEIFTQPPDEWDIPEEREDTPETEMDYTPGGRPIYVGGVSPSGRRADPAQQRRETAADETSVEALKAKGAAYWCAQCQCPVSEKHYNSCEYARDAIQAEKSGRTPKPPLSSPGTAPNEPAPSSSTGKPVGEAPLGKVIVDHVGPDDAIVRGDLANLSPLIEKHCAAKFIDGWLHVSPQQLGTLAGICKQENYELEVHEPPSAKDKKKAPKRQQRATPGEHIVAGVIEQALPKGGKSPSVDFLVKTVKGSFWMKCWSKTWFQRLAEPPLPKDAILVIDTKVKDDKTYRNILRATKIGRKDYDDDGNEVIQNSTREAGGKTLFT